MMNTGWAWFDKTISTRFIAALVAFVINYAAYFSEIFRGGIQSIPKGQYEAGQVLGMTKGTIFSKVVFMQVIKRIVPPMSNEIITLIKDTSLANTISVLDIIFYGKEFMLTKGLIWPIFYAGAFYLIFVGILTLLFGYIEKKLSYYKV
jgi:polar amino acid transport system permease protein